MCQTSEITQSYSKSAISAFKRKTAHATLKVWLKSLENLN